MISKEKRLERLRKRVYEKLYEGYFKSAVRLASSDGRLAANSKETLDALLSKHSAPPPDSVIPPPFSSKTVEIHEADIHAFPNGTAGGPTRLHPQNLKDMLQCSKSEVSAFVSTLAALCSLMLGDSVPEAVQPSFFGATLVKLEKNS